MAFTLKTSAVLTALRTKATGTSGVTLKTIAIGWPPFWLQAQTTQLLPALFMDPAGGSSEDDDIPSLLQVTCPVSLYYIVAWPTTGDSNPYDTALTGAEAILQKIMEDEHLGDDDIYLTVRVTQTPGFRNACEALLRENDQHYVACGFEIEAVYITDRPKRA